MARCAWAALPIKWGMGIQIEKNGPKLEESSPLDLLRRGIFVLLRELPPNGFGAWPASEKVRAKALANLRKAARVARLNPLVLGCRDIDGNTPLHWAARYPWPEFLEEFLRLGADPSAQNGSGAKPGHIAALFSGIECVRPLLEASPGASDNGSLALHGAAHWANAAGISACLALGEDPNAPDGQGRTALHWLCSGAKKEAAYPSLDLLLAAGADAGARDGQGALPLELAQAEGSALAPRLERFLIEGQAAAAPARGARSI